MNRIVLVRPKGPRNVGSIVRAIANFGPAELVLVRPEKPSLLIHPDFEQMSHGVEDVTRRLTVVDDLETALADVTCAYGFTARAREHRTLHDWRERVAPILERTADPGEHVAFVFGNEETGLAGTETDLLHELVRMPTSDEHTSLNLALSVGVVLSTLFFAGARSARLESTTPLTGRDRRFLIAHLQDALGERTTSDSARRDLVATIERVFSRAPLETRDGRAWHLLARALGSRKRPQDYGLDPPTKTYRQMKKCP